MELVNLKSNGPVAASKPIQVKQALFIPGYLPGLSQPCVILDLELPAQISRQTLQHLDHVLAQAGLISTGPVPPHASVQAHGLLSRFVAGSFAVLERGGMPVAAQAIVVGKTSGSPGGLRLAVPSYVAPQATLKVLTWLAELMNLALEQRAVDGALAKLPALLKQLDQHAPRGINSRPFLHAAHEASVPVRHVWENVYQFGWGSRGRRLDSSLTDETSFISSQLSRSKRAAARAMRDAGIPVPRHEVARSPDHAVSIAVEMGYPVVVKPGDQDGGRGVAAGLKSEEAVRKAFGVARALSEEVLVEKHFEGHDYRVHVYKDEVFWVTHRMPGGVTGDGVNAVDRLLEQANADPRRGVKGSKSQLTKLELDEEATDLLAEQGFTPSSIPPAGLFVRLRRAANISSGGTPRPVLAQAHPDNLALAVRATRIIGLDLAGVDLLIPDISRSWLETGAAICEINPQPQYNDLNALAGAFHKLIAGDGRIPVVVVLGEQDSVFYQRLADALAPFGCVGTATPDEIRIGTTTVGRGPFRPYDAGLALLGDTAVDLAVVGFPDTSALATGMPVDAFDVLVLAGPMKNGGGADDWQRWRGFAAMLASMCRGSVIVNQDCVEWTAEGVDPGLKRAVLASSGRLPEAVSLALASRA